MLKTVSWKHKGWFYFGGSVFFLVISTPSVWLELTNLRSRVLRSSGRESQAPKKTRFLKWCTRYFHAFTFSEYALKKKSLWWTLDIEDTVHNRHKGRYQLPKAVLSPEALGNCQPVLCFSKTNEKVSLKSVESRREQWHPVVYIFWNEHL